MKIQVKKIENSAIVPRQMQEGDAGMDIFSNEDVILHPGERISCRSGIAIKIPAGYVGLIWDKSSVSQKSGIKTLGGVIDSNYTGEWFIGLVNLSQEDYAIKKGQKIAQVIFQKIDVPEIELVDELPETNRGDGAFGSTDKK
ncbi:MAG: dUTP diphosphatase [Candidatus Moranbacteria bacterium]|jgi:dUTP pyrophosphatase|nr:dUTP diphosphatase [Candidatus Moranbacteria bacterium]